MRTDEGIESNRENKTNHANLEKHIIPPKRSKFYLLRLDFLVRRFLFNWLYRPKYNFTTLDLTIDF